MSAVTEEAIRFPAGGVTGSCESPGTGAGNNTLVLWTSSRHMELLSQLCSPTVKFLVLVATNNFYNFNIQLKLKFISISVESYVYVFVETFTFF